MGVYLLNGTQRLFLQRDFQHLHLNGGFLSILANPVPPPPPTYLNGCMKHTFPMIFPLKGMQAVFFSPNGCQKFGIVGNVRILSFSIFPPPSYCLPAKVVQNLSITTPSPTPSQGNLPGEGPDTQPDHLPDNLPFVHASEWHVGSRLMQPSISTSTKQAASWEQFSQFSQQQAAIIITISQQAADMLKPEVKRKQGQQHKFKPMHFLKVHGWQSWPHH